MFQNRVSSHDVRIAETNSWGYEPGESVTRIAKILSKLGAFNVDAITPGEATLPFSVLPPLFPPPSTLQNEQTCFWRDCLARKETGSHI